MDIKMKQTKTKREIKLEDEISLLEKQIIFLSKNNTIKNTKNQRDKNELLYSYINALKYIESYYNKSKW
jgi:hypothetical protein